MSNDDGGYFDDLPDGVKDKAGDGGGYFDSDSVKARAAEMDARARRRKLIADIRHLETIDGLASMGRAARLRRVLDEHVHANDGIMT